MRKISTHHRQLHRHGNRLHGQTRHPRHQGQASPSSATKTSEKDNHPDFTVLSGNQEIGVAWERGDDRGHYISVSFEEPSFAPGYYTLTKSGAEKGYTLTYKRPMPKKDGK